MTPPENMQYQQQVKGFSWLGLRKKFTLCLDVFKYVLNCPWDNFYRGVEAIATDPDQHLGTWIERRNEENSFIGMTASVISATVAILANTQNLDIAPWVASAAFYVSLFLAVMAVITAMHQTIFFNSMRYLPSSSEQLRHILGILPHQTPGSDPRWRRCVWRGTFMYSLPQLVLTYSIFAMFVGLGLVTICPLWVGNEDGVWESSQKVAVAAVVGIFLCILAFVTTITSQFSAPQA